jgi:D-xylose 1-dehydrogenase
MKVHTAHYPSLAGRAVLVTGGATGIGEAIVTACARQQMRVGLIDLDVPAGHTLCNRLAAEAGVAHAPVFAAADLSDVDALRVAIGNLRTHCGPFTGLVNNAANDRREVLDGVTPQSWDAGIAVNLRQQFFCAQALLPDLRAAGGGSIVNLGSASWKLKQGGMPVYTTSKAAIQGLTRSLARDLGPDRIRVNTLVPGWVMTPRQVATWATPEARAEVARVQCLPGHVMAEDIAAMALFLLSDDSRMCTAQDFIVDAGWS